jgi:hypothetical protein
VTDEFLGRDITASVPIRRRRLRLDELTQLALLLGRIT